MTARAGSARETAQLRLAIWTGTLLAAVGWTYLIAEVVWPHWIPRMILVAALAVAVTFASVAARNAIEKAGQK